jgi:hypothetical protein
MIYYPGIVVEILGMLDNLLFGMALLTPAEQGIFAVVPLDSCVVDFKGVAGPERL